MPFLRVDREEVLVAGKISVTKVTHYELLDLCPDVEGDRLVATPPCANTT